jgi:hypothetical protein
MVQRRMVLESLGNTGPQQRSGAVVRDVSPEEVALTACHDAAVVVAMLHQQVAYWATGGGVDPLTLTDEALLGELIDGLYERWESLGVWKPGEARVPVRDGRVVWEG